MLTIAVLIQWFPDLRVSWTSRISKRKKNWGPTKHCQLFIIASSDLWERASAVTIIFYKNGYFSPSKVGNMWLIWLESIPWSGIHWCLIVLMFLLWLWPELGALAHHLGTSGSLGNGRVDCFCALSPEALAFSCFTELMKRMNQNFPHGGAMDTHFANMRSLIQVWRSPIQ